MSAFERPYANRLGRRKNGCWLFVLMSTKRKCYHIAGIQTTRVQVLIIVVIIVLG